MAKGRKTALGMVLMLACFPGAPLGLIGWGVARVVEQSRAVEHYEPVGATVTHVGYDSADYEDDEGYTYTAYWPVVRFVYEVDGVAHENGAYAPEWNRHEDYDIDDMRARVEGLVPGAEVDAWLTARDPPEAYIDAPTKWSRAGPLWWGLGLLVLPPFFLWFFLVLPGQLNRWMR